MSVRILVDGGNSGSGGYLHHLRGILSAGIPDDMRILLLCSPEIAAAVGPLDARVTVRAEPLLSSFSRSKRLSWWRTQYSQLVDDYQPDIVLHPSGILRGDSRGTPTVVTHHNVTPFSLPSYRLYGASRESAMFLFWWWRLRRSLRRATGVIFLAEHTRSTVSCHVGGIRRTAIVPNGLSEPFLQMPAREASALTEPVRLLCVSTLWLFKYQWNVVDAVSTLRAQLGMDLRVDFVGGGEPKARAKLHRRIHELNAESYATVADDISPDAMPDIYRRADLFVFPSTQEVCPITLLEAMSFGLPIACSDRMPMPEVLRDGGCYFDPTVPASIAAALTTLLTDEAARTAYGKRAQELAQQYTWPATADAVFAFLRDVVKAVGR